MNINESFYCSKCLREMDDEGVCPFCGYDEEENVRDPQALEEGTLLHDRRYRIGALIGKGGFGMTYAAWDQTLQCAVAIKEYFPEGFAQRDAWEELEVKVRPEDRVVFNLGLSNFSREAHILAALENVPHVVKVSNCFEENGTGYIVMEYVRGVTLMDYVRTHSLSAEALLTMLREPIDSLVLIHAQGVMHRDITPGNLMVLEDGTIKLIDFGAAHVSEDKIKGRSYAIAATAHYAAPEQYDPQMQQGQWTDVYGLSATAYALLTGCEPPDAKERMRRDTLVPPRQMGKGLSKRQERALIEGLRIDPKSRLRSVEEFRAILYNLPTPEIVRQRKKVFWQMARGLAAAAALAMLLAVNFFFGFPLGEGLRYALYPDGWHVIGGRSGMQAIAIPETRLMLPVTQVREQAFAGETSIREVTIPGSVRRIGDQAFYGGETLEMLALGEGVEEIGRFAFAGCAQMHTVNLPSTLTSIGEFAFLDVPTYLTAWGTEDARVRQLAEAAGIAYALRDDYSATIEDGEATLTAYAVKAEHHVMPSYIDGCPVTAISDSCVSSMFDYSVESVVLPYFLTHVPQRLCDRARLIESVVLGPYVERIGKAAFNYTNIKTIDLPDSLRVIEEDAFRGSALIAVDLPESLLKIGDDAFSFTRLTEVVIPESVKTLGESAFSSIDTLLRAKVLAPLETIGDQFSDCAHLITVELPEGVKTIEMLAFLGDISLEYMALPESLESIEYGAFTECINLKFVDIPNRITDVHPRAFTGCRKNLIISGQPASMALNAATEGGYRFVDRTGATQGLVKNGVINARNVSGDIVCPIYDEETKTLIKRVERLDTRYLGEPITSVVLPACATEIGYGVFADSGIKSVVLPNTLEWIDSSVFENCRQLETIDLPQSLVGIGYGAFENCVNLRSVELPPALQIIGQSAFENCASITEVTIPPLVTALAAYSFTGTAIEEIVIPSNVVSCSSAFSDCLTLRTAVVQEGCRSMYNTFMGCAALETLSLPSTLDMLCAGEYAGCVSLKDVYVLNEALRIVCEGFSFSFYSPAPELTQEQRETGDHPFKDAKDVTIHGYPGSTAQMYAEAFGLAFAPLEE